MNADDAVRGSGMTRRAFLSNTCALGSSAALAQLFDTHVLAEEDDMPKLPGIPYGLNYPFGRAIKSITGEESYYRWEPGASGRP